MTEEPEKATLAMTISMDRSEEVICELKLKDGNETVMQRLEEIIPGRENHKYQGLEAWTNLILGPFPMCFLLTRPLIPVLGTGLGPDAQPLGS